MHDMETGMRSCRISGQCGAALTPIQAGGGLWPTWQAHSCPRSLNNSFPGHPQIRERKQRDQLPRVLGQALVSDLGESKLALDDSKRMLDLGAYTGLNLLQLFNQLMAAPILVQRSALARSHCYMPVHPARLGTLHGPLVARIGKHRHFFP